MHSPATHSTSPVESAAITSGPTLSGVRAAHLLASLAGPLVAGGVIARRRSIMPLLEKWQTDADTVTTIAELRAKYGPGPLLLDLPGRRIALPLVAQDVKRILDRSPDDFTPANREKQASLSPFQPHGVLISRGSVRGPRRHFNENVLDTGQSLHHLAGAIASAVDDEMSVLVERVAAAGGELSAATFLESWWYMVRRVVLGDAAREDNTVTDELWKLRARGNWAYLRPNRRRLRDRFLDRLYDYVDDADPLSLAGAVAAARPESAVDPVGQIPHWLFAFDAAGIVTLRTLATLAAQPAMMQRAIDESRSKELSSPAVLPYLQACVLESTRLWPTTPAILRDSVTPTTWGPAGGRFEISSGTAFLILATAFHRDRDAVPFADDFTPDAWLDGRASRTAGLVPFSDGPARCPGENLVLFIASTAIAHLVSAFPELTLVSKPGLSADGPLPSTVNHYSIALRTRGGA
ncbi:MAG: cytochrome P450 [Rhodococcus sp. (in: high G+C Gram-positive bacteria)]